MFMVFTPGSKRDSASLRFDASLRGFQDANDSKSRFAVGERLFAIANTLGEVSHHDLEGFHAFDAR
jgi:hypothetical protein